jgi:DNA mismatch repair ATPase MutS
VFAERWVAPRFTVRTSIGRADSLLEGKSYYLAEVEAIGALLTAAGAPRLVLIDELFRGTNTIERVAAAKAVLAQLERNHDLVIMATHDVELLDLLPEYVPYHFREEIVNGELTFDHRLHAGRSATRNALAILATAGYPETVVEDARAVAEEIAQSAGARTIPKAAEGVAPARA